MKNIISLFCVLMVGLALVAQLTRPTPAYADDDNTPQPTSALEVTSTPAAPTDAPTAIIPLETSTPEPALVTSTSLPTSTEIPAETSAPISPTDTSAEPAHIKRSTQTPFPRTPTASPTDIPIEAATFPLPTLTVTTPALVDAGTLLGQPTLLETVQLISSDTSVMVLDANGQPLSLASQAAADVIATSDPVWCPDGVAPGGIGCTAAYATMNDLLAGAGAYINTLNVNGTIWITSGFVPDAAPIIIDGATYTNWANYSLTLQGGWSGISGNTTIGSNSIFNVPIGILNWNNTVTINNITVDGATGSGLGVTTFNHKVNINNSSITNSHSDYSGISYFPYGDGADIFTNGGDIAVTNSHFDGNTWDGIFTSTTAYDPITGNPIGSGNITVTGSTFNNNLIGGLDTASVGTINVANTQFTNNSYYDLTAFCDTPPYNYLNLLFPDPPSISFAVDPTCIFSSGTTGITTGKKVTHTLPKIGGRDIARSGSQQSAILDCRNQSGLIFRFPLPNGDRVEIICPVHGDATITRLDNTILPGALPVGYQYASAFEVDISQYTDPLAKMSDGTFKTEPVNVITEGGYINVSFVTPTAQSSGAYTILWWDDTSSQWIPLNDFASGRIYPLFPANPADKRKILSGVLLNSGTVPSRDEVNTNFPGIFVLAQH